MIDLTPPTTTIGNHPAVDSNSTTATLTFASSEAGTFECRLDNGAFAACTSSIAYASLADGSHTFSVKATDLAGNVDPNPASFTWVVDTVAPDTSISTAPATVSNSANAAFTFASNEASAVFECSLDAAAYAACAGGDTTTYQGLTNGSHIFQVRSIDRAGNVDATPASYTWTVDSGAPVTTISGRPANPTNSSTAVFTFVSTKVGSTFRCSLDSAALAACSSPQAYTGLADGSHTFAVQATDSAGNVEAQPVSVSWTVDTIAPDTNLVAHPAASAWACAVMTVRYAAASSRPCAGPSRSLSVSARSTCSSVARSAPRRRRCGSGSRTSRSVAKRSTPLPTRADAPAKASRTSSMSRRTAGSGWSTPSAPIPRHPKTTTS